MFKVTGWRRGLSGLLVLFFLLGPGAGTAATEPTAAPANPIVTAGNYPSGSLIRFHVLANSDSEEDQALKRAVRDAILTELSPRLAQAQSLEDSRRIVQELRPLMENIAAGVIRSWGKDYEVHTEYGRFAFPTKSYGSLVLPAGDYEALRVVIGRGAGSNWWCVLFPPLCFVDIEHSTAVPVDGKPGVPIQQGVKPGSKPGNAQEQAAKEHTGGRPQLRFWLWEKIRSLLLRQ